MTLDEKLKFLLEAMTFLDKDAREEPETVGITLSKDGVEPWQLRIADFNDETVLESSSQSLEEAIGLAVNEAQCRLQAEKDRAQEILNRAKTDIYQPPTDPMGR